MFWSRLRRGSTLYSKPIEQRNVNERNGKCQWKFEQMERVANEDAIFIMVHGYIPQSPHLSGLIYCLLVL